LSEESLGKPHADRIRHLRRDDGGAFVVMRDRRRVAELTYDLSATTMAIDHTFVEPALRGAGIAQQLLDDAVAWAREHQRRIVPICPFVKTVFSRSPAKYADVRA
jgi:predicted GNAT family acetyltransferase